MRHTARWLVVISVAAITAAAVILSFPSRLPLPQPKFGPLPHIPAQPLRATVECVGGLDLSMIDVGREWSVIQDHPPCAVGGVVLTLVKATPAEMSGDRSWCYRLISPPIQLL